ncbi:MAG: tRNA adenosine(34) deaminase TadA [Balneolales bacterium]|nr:tRNA adenosine(34) deaminase TadA [Balneolales bacterium]
MFNNKGENKHRKFMQMALAEAQLALAKGEIPVGAIVVKEDQVIGRGHNLVEQLKDPTAHAEMIAISAACSTINDKFLSSCTIYVTMEPCPMCSGALVWSRLKQVVIGCLDPKTGSCGSLFNIASNKKLNHQLEIVHNVMEEECSQLVKLFFRMKR